MPNPFGAVLPAEQRQIEMEMIREAHATRLEPYVKTPEMPAELAHHKEQRRTLANNLFVQITKKYPHIPRSKRKDMAKKIAYARVAEFLVQDRARRAELDALRKQDYDEAAPPPEDKP